MRCGTRIPPRRSDWSVWRICDCRRPRRGGGIQVTHFRCRSSVCHGCDSNSWGNNNNGMALYFSKLSGGITFRLLRKKFLRFLLKFLVFWKPPTSGFANDKKFQTDMYNIRRICWFKFIIKIADTHSTALFSSSRRRSRFTPTCTCAVLRVRLACRQTSSF